MTGVKPPPARDRVGHERGSRSAAFKAIMSRLVVFQGAGFENDENLKRAPAQAGLHADYFGTTHTASPKAKSLLLDYFGGGRPDKVSRSHLFGIAVFGKPP